MKTGTKGCIMLVVVLMLLTGCKSIFLASKRLDMGPFGDSTSAMINDVQRDLLARKPLYIKPYLLLEADFAEFQSRWSNMQTILRNIALYSTQVVTLSRSKVTEAKKAESLAQYIDTLVAPLIVDKDTGIRLTRPELDAVLTSIRSKETLLEALGTAQPLVDSTKRFCNSVFDDLSLLLARIIQATQERIDSNSAAILESAAYLKALQVRSLKSYSLLYELRLGNSRTLEALLKNDPILKQGVKTESSVDPRSLDIIEKNLMTRLQNISLMTEQIRPQLEQYRAETRELDEYGRANEDTIRKARIAVQIWGRSHGNLAAGIATQPSVDMKGILSEAATSAAKKVLTIH